MLSIYINRKSNLTDLEDILKDTPQTFDIANIFLARSRKQQFFKDAALFTFFATLARRGAVVMVDRKTEWNKEEELEHYAENLAGLAGVIFSINLANAADMPAPLQKDAVREAVIRRGGLLKKTGVSESNVRELAFIAFDPECREPLHLAGLLNQSEAFVSTLLKFKRTLLDFEPDVHPDLFGGGASAQDALAKFLFELYQNGAEHGNRDGNELIRGMRSLSIRRHNPGTADHLSGFAEGFPEVEEYIKRRMSVSRGTAYYEVSVCDGGLGILDRFLSRRPEYAEEANVPGGRLALLLRVLLTPSSPDGNGSAAPPVALTSKDTLGVERGAGRGLERALEAVANLYGFVSLRTDSYWLYRSFPLSTEIGETAMFEVAGGPFSKVAGTCFTALFPINLTS